MGEGACRAGSFVLCLARPAGRATLNAMTHHPPGLLVAPNPQDPRLTQRVAGVNEAGERVEIGVVVERGLTLYLNAQEIVTMMTINDYPEYLALGYLLNQNMLQPDDVVTGVDYDEDLPVVVVRTERQTNFEDKLKKRTQTSGCAQGTAFGDLMEALEGVACPTAPLRTSWLYRLTHAINTTPSLYLEAGAIHGCVLAREDRPLVYMEDVGRHNAVDKIAGWMFRHARARTKDLLHHRPPHLRDGDQDRADGHPDPGLALRLHGLGRRAGAQCGPHADRPRARQALRRALGRGPHRVRPGPVLRRGGERQAPAQGGGDEE